MVDIKEIEVRTKEMWFFDYGKHFSGNEIVMYYTWIGWIDDSQERSKKKQQIINYLIRNNYIKKIGRDYYKNIFTKN